MSTSQHASSSTAVPSPTADFATFLPHITSALDALTTHAASLPGRSDLAFHRTLDRKFAKELDVTSARVLGMTERLLALVEEGKGKVAGRRKLKDEEDVVDGYRRGVSGVVDGLLEDAVGSISIDESVVRR